ncbi:alpha/beta fold hydrolase [Variovorax guangxiensis]|uniref:alpha/beta fold hydrolase n=1 Tax=Variovorax guangxiensis TaxID=1775474 RepID=UPI0028574EF2|nr:alpha/beta fold hydrolase [Variovorax guangxiensis]MDR6858740.1 pimeloyl-ACP methyl ester carboxylesterase [Variovorax guangxiensis]
MHMNDIISIGDMHVRVAGHGPALVFCHGYTTTGEFWRQQMGAFSRDHRLVVPDLPGHGRSASPRSRRYTIDAFVNDLVLLFDKLRLDDAILVGLSMGGTIAQRFALAHPSRLRALVLVGATPHGLGPDVNVKNVLQAIDTVGVTAASQAVIDRSFGSAASAELLAFAREQVAHTPEFVAREAIVSLNEADSRAQLARLALPTLVVCGEEDAITPPAESHALAAGIPGAILQLVPSAAHFPMLEQPERFNASLRDFIARIDKRSGA